MRVITCFKGVIWKIILSGALRKPRRLIRAKYFAGIRKCVSPFVNTGDKKMCFTVREYRGYTGDNTNFSIYSFVSPSVFN